MRSLYLLAIACFSTAPLNAQGWIEPRPDHPGSFGIAKLRTVVSVRVAGRVAQVEVEEWFRNSGRPLNQGDYLYPIPGEAVFTSFSLFQGDQELRGETMDADEARRIYQEIVRRKRDPALIELAGHGLIRARVFPFAAGETRKITLRYTQLLAQAGDALQLRYAAGGPMSNRSATEGGIAARPIREPAPIAFQLVVEDGDRFHDPFSPTHEMRVTRDGDRLTVRPRGKLVGDLTLFLPLARPTVGITVATHRPVGEDGYFMLTLSPGRTTARSVPRAVTVVLDVSGSMSGSKLDQAKTALGQLLSTLGPNDQFRLLAFSNRVRAYRREWSSVTDANLRTSRAWIERLEAGGGTNIEEALAETFRIQPRGDRLPLVVFVTDGLPSVGERNPERIAQQAESNRGDARVFTFGVGYDVNTYLLDRLSAAGKGITHYVQPGEDVERAIGLLTAKIQHPVLTDLAIGSTPAELYDIYPTTLPDLFADDALVIFGRYRPSRNGQTGSVVITGRRDGRVERFDTRATFSAHTEQDEFIPGVWASRKIGNLSRQLRLHGPNEELEQEIRETALRYGLLSEYTSYLVQEPGDIASVGSIRPLRRTAAAPSEAVGRMAVMSAHEEQKRREASSKIEADAADRALLARGHWGQAVHVAGRLFNEIDAVWTDLAHADSLDVVEIEPFSEAYFALLERLPELVPYAARFEQVQIAGANVAIRIAGGGQSTLAATRLTRLAREFRGR